MIKSFFVFKNRGGPYQEDNNWDSRKRSGSISGSSIDAGSKLHRKLSNISCPPPGRGLPHSTSVFDLNSHMHHQHMHGFAPMQQVNNKCFHAV